MYKRAIEKSEVSLDERLRKAFSDNFELLKDFISDNYNKYRIKEDKIEDITLRLQEQRNNFAHGNIDKEIDSITILDLRIVELLLYTMRLKDLGVENENIKSAIRSLFNIQVW
jgi:hypothetical protein